MLCIPVLRVSSLYLSVIESLTRRVLCVQELMTKHSRGEMVVHPKLEDRPRWNVSAEVTWKMMKKGAEEAYVIVLLAFL